MRRRCCARRRSSPADAAVAGARIFGAGADSGRAVSVGCAAVAPLARPVLARLGGVGVPGRGHVVGADAPPQHHRLVQPRFLAHLVPGADLYAATVHRSGAAARIGCCECAVAAVFDRIPAGGSSTATAPPSTTIGQPQRPRLPPGVWRRAARLAIAFRAPVRAGVRFQQRVPAATVGERQHQAAVLLAVSGCRIGGLRAGAAVPHRRLARQAAGAAAGAEHDFFGLFGYAPGIGRRARHAADPFGHCGRAVDSRQHPLEVGDPDRRSARFTGERHRWSHALPRLPRVAVVARLHQHRRARAISGAHLPRRGAQRHRAGGGDARAPHQPHSDGSGVRGVQVLGVDRVLPTSSRRRGKPASWRSARLCAPLRPTVAHVHRRGTPTRSNSVTCFWTRPTSHGSGVTITHPASVQLAGGTAVDGHGGGDQFSRPRDALRPPAHLAGVSVERGAARFRYCCVVGVPLRLPPLSHAGRALCAVGVGTAGVAGRALPLAGLSAPLRPATQISAPLPPSPPTVALGRGDRPTGRTDCIRAAPPGRSHLPPGQRGLVTVRQQSTLRLRPPGVHVYGRASVRLPVPARLSHRRAADGRCRVATGVPVADLAADRRRQRSAIRGQLAADRQCGRGVVIGAAGGVLGWHGAVRVDVAARLGVRVSHRVEHGPDRGEQRPRRPEHLLVRVLGAPDAAAALGHVCVAAEPGGDAAAGGGVRTTPGEHRRHGRCGSTIARCGRHHWHVAAAASARVSGAGAGGRIAVPHR
eukprot:ctg_1007.g417